MENEQNNNHEKLRDEQEEVEEKVKEKKDRTGREKMRKMEEGSQKQAKKGGERGWSEENAKEWGGQVEGLVQGGATVARERETERECCTCLLSPNMLHTISLEYGCSSTYRSKPVCGSNRSFRTNM